jgi:DNA-directed RNA polymerase specialized sigma24 family protein
MCPADRVGYAARAHYIFVVFPRTRSWRLTMATEEHYPSLYTTLYNAMKDRKLTDLLQHPEFRRKAGQICKGIAGPEGGADLLQEVCVRMLESPADLDPDSIRGEGEFFAWFSRLARCVHLGRVLSAAAVNRCMDVTARWPDSSADVSPDDMESFLTHADACAYHARLLRAEDEELCAAFGRARGLDGRGRILLGEELKSRIADHGQRLKRWREVALREGELYGQVALFNADRKVASCGWFSDFSNHQSRHELDPYAGLQIRGISSSDPDEDVLLGFYALANVGHGGEEKVLPLDNGYTICLKVEEKGGNYFDIHFRCVDTKTLKAESVATAGSTGVNYANVQEMSGDKSADNLPRSPESSVPSATPLPPAVWWRSPRVWQATAAGVLFLSILPPLCFLMGRTWGRTEEVEDALLSQLTGAEINAPSPTGAEKVSGADSQSQPVVGREQRGDAGKPSPASRSRLEQVQRAKALRGVQSNKGVPGSTAEIQDFLNRLPAGTSTDGSVLQPVGTQSAPDGNRVGYRRPETPTLLLTHEDQALSTPSSLVNISTNDRKSSTGYSVLHVIKDGLLGGKLYNALREQSLHVESVAEQGRTAARFTVQWDAHVDSTGKIKVVVLYANISTEGEKKFAEPPSYTGVGHSLNAAYDDAVGQAVKSVIERIRSVNDERLSASASEASGEEQPAAALPEATVSSGYSGNAETNPDRVEQQYTSQQVKDGCNKE